LLGFGRNLRQLAIKKNDDEPAHWPTLEAVLSRDYPLGWAIHCYTIGEPKDGAKALLEWLLSPSGMEAIRETVPWMPVE
jgi:ABC-type phosphate transport system substrate-binding protein